MLYMHIFFLYVHISDIESVDFEIDKITIS